MSKKHSYISLKDSVHYQEITDIITTCQSLFLPQKTILAACTFYFRHIKDHKKVPDTVALTAACILLACKVIETHRPYLEIVKATLKHFNKLQDVFKKPLQESRVEQLCEAVFNLEVQMCLECKFEINYRDVYVVLQKFCMQRNVGSDAAKSAWVLLNDTGYLPLAIFFGTKKIVEACVYLARFVNEKNLQIEDTKIDSKKDIKNLVNKNNGDVVDKEKSEETTNNNRLQGIAVEGTECDSNIDNYIASKRNLENVEIVNNKEEKRSCEKEINIECKNKDVQITGNTMIQEKELTIGHIEDNGNSANIDINDDKLGIDDDILFIANEILSIYDRCFI